MREPLIKLSARATAHPLIHSQSPSGKQGSTSNRGGCRQHCFAVGSGTVHRQSRNVQTALQALQKQIVTVFTWVCWGDIQWWYLSSGHTPAPPRHPIISGVACSPLPAFLVLHSSVLLEIYILPAHELTNRVVWAKLFRGVKGILVCISASHF